VAIPIPNPGSHRRNIVVLLLEPLEVPGGRSCHLELPPAPEAAAASYHAAPLGPRVALACAAAAYVVYVLLGLI
jgi:hypothetical protein